MIKKMFLLVFTFSILSICLTFLNYKLEVIEAKIVNTDAVNKKLENELNFIKSEWEFINSPKNIAFLVETHLKHQPAELININDFINIIIGKGDTGE